MTTRMNEQILALDLLAIILNFDLVKTCWILPSNRSSSFLMFLLCVQPSNVIIARVWIILAHCENEYNNKGNHSGPRPSFVRAQIFTGYLTTYFINFIRYPPSHYSLFYKLYFTIYYWSLNIVPLFILIQLKQLFK